MITPPQKALDMHCVKPDQVLIKELWAWPGETVCREGRILFVRGRADARVTTSILDREAQLIAIPFSGCHTLASKEFFVVGEHPSSCDSRYFGPVSSTHILGSVEPFLVDHPPRSMRFSGVDAP